MLYHISFNRFPEDYKLEPRIPNPDVDWEDCITKRICVSDSIEGCLKATPNTSDAYLMSSNCNVPAIVYVYGIEEKDIEPNNLLKPRQIYGKVFDCLNTREHWIVNQYVTPRLLYAIEVEGQLTVF